MVVHKYFPEEVKLLKKLKEIPKEKDQS